MRENVASKVSQGGLRVCHHDLGEAIDVLQTGHKCGACSGVVRCLEEVVAVYSLTRQRNVERTRRHLPRIHHEGVNGGVLAVELATGRIGDAGS